MTRLREQDHVARAERHRKIGDLLADAGDEWAAVPLFYSGYHYVKAALLCDPIWGDLQSLVAISPELMPQDRYTERHKGRRRPTSSPEWGINDLVLKLYRSSAGGYDRLHQGSISVRYGMGLPEGALPQLRACLDDLQSKFESGELVAPSVHG